MGWRRLGLDAELLAPAAARDRLGRGDVGLVRLDVAPTLDGIERGFADIARVPERGVRVFNRPARCWLRTTNWPLPAA